MEQDAARVRRIRSELDEAGVYGVRASVKEGSLGDGVLGPMLFNLIVSERHLLEGQLPPATGAEVVRSLVPSGGTWCLGKRIILARRSVGWAKGEPPGSVR
ncbi:MAG: hypothetical protein Ct9H300mP7_5090 [Verrucomicrobiota bacterium]|nr:MAG: hypothetical protein Ct9H300mP7_5090 [Verrucomicrobiota bacterium]